MDKVGTVFVLIDSRQVIDPSRSQLIGDIPCSSKQIQGFDFIPNQAMI